MKRRAPVRMIAAAIVLGGPFAARAQSPDERPVVVASKPFGESYLLCEMFAQLLEARGLRVERRPGLGATEVAFGALRTGAIDVYPEYTGTGLLAILGEKPISDERAVYRRVAEVFQSRYGVRWLAPLGFENGYAVAVRSWAWLPSYGTSSAAQRVRRHEIASTSKKEK